MSEIQQASLQAGDKINIENRLDIAQVVHVLGLTCGTAVRAVLPPGGQLLVTAGSEELRITLDELKDQHAGPGMVLASKQDGSALG